MGRADEAASVMANGVALARELSHPFSLAMALIHASALHLERGAAFAGRDHGMEALAIAREQSFSLLSSWASCYAGASRVALGELREGLAMIRDGVAGARATGSQMFHSHILALLAKALAATGARDEAARTIDEALQSSAETGEAFCLPELHRLKRELNRCITGAPHR